MTHKFTYQHTNARISTTIEVDKDANLGEMVEAFEQYLRVCGYYMDGKSVRIDDGNEDL